MIIIYTKTSYHPIQTEKIPNAKCPNCGTPGEMDMTLYQEHRSNGLSYIVSKKLTGSVHCNACNQDIPAVKWTPEMEEFFERMKRQAPIQNPSSKLTPSFKIILYVFLGFLSILIGIAVYAVNKRMNEMDRIKNPEVGNAYHIFYGVIKNGGYAEPHGFTWAKIDKIDGDTLYFQLLKNKKIENGTTVDFSSDNFDPTIYKVRKSDLEQKHKMVSYEKGEGNIPILNSEIYDSKKLNND